VAVNDPAVRKALLFIERCQNFGDEPAFDDGGFHFIYDDAVRNKAGVAGTDPQGRDRFASYGSTTADGLRVLLLCGLPLDHPRVAAAKGWLETNFNAAAHPGRYAPGREALRPALYYYYACSVAQALKQVQLVEGTEPQPKAKWADALAD